MSCCLPWCNMHPSLTLRLKTRFLTTLRAALAPIKHLYKANSYACSIVWLRMIDARMHAGDVGIKERQAHCLASLVRIFKPSPHARAYSTDAPIPCTQGITVVNLFIVLSSDCRVIVERLSYTVPGLPSMTLSLLCHGRMLARCIALQCNNQFTVMVKSRV